MRGWPVLVVYLRPRRLPADDCPVVDLVANPIVAGWMTAVGGSGLRLDLAELLFLGVGHEPGPAGVAPIPEVAVAVHPRLDAALAPDPHVAETRGCVHDTWSPAGAPSPS